MSRLSASSASMYNDATKNHDESGAPKLRESSWPGGDASIKDGRGSGRGAPPLAASGPGETDRARCAIWSAWPC